MYDQSGDDKPMPATQFQSASIRRSTYERILAHAGKLQQQLGARVSVSDAIDDALNQIATDETSLSLREPNLSSSESA